MFAARSVRIFRVVQSNTVLIGKSLRPLSSQFIARSLQTPLQYRMFSNLAEEGEKAKEVAKQAATATKEASEKVVEKKSASMLRQTAAGVTIGFVASALGSMAGLGGGFIIIPLLTSLGGLSQHQAAACSLASICVNAITGTCTYISQGLIDIPAALTITATSMIMSKYGSKWSHNFDSKKLKKYYGWLCLLVAPLIPMKNYIMQKRKEEEAQKQAQVVVNDLAEENAKFGYRDCLSMESMKKSEAVEHAPLLLTLGLIAGSMSGFFGVGGGIIVSPSLCLFTSMIPKKIMGTSLV